MHTSFLINAILLLSSFFYAAVVAASEEYAAVLVERQTSPNDPQCLDYASTANLAIIGGNSTYRSAFLQASPAGTLGNSQMLDAAIKKLPALTNNAALNQECGNKTSLAITEAATNFTLGVVAQFSGVAANPQAIVHGGPELIVILGGVLAIFGGVWISMP